MELKAKPSHPIAQLSVVRQDCVRTGAVVLSAELIYSLGLHRGKQRRVGGGSQCLAVLSSIVRAGWVHRSTGQSSGEKMGWRVHPFCLTY